MKKTISMILCLMILCVACISVASADSTSFSYTLQSRTVNFRAAAKSGYYVRLRNFCLHGVFRRADHLTGGGKEYTVDSTKKTSAWSAKGKDGPWIKLSVSATNSADDFVRAWYDGYYEYVTKKP